eukprot:428889-Ditylum_brightwellii.AAC.1
MIERGANFIGTQTKQQLSIKIKFMVKKEEKAYPICAELIALLKLLQAVDNDIKVTLTNGSKTWTDFTEFLIGNAFETLLKVH